MLFLSVRRLRFLLVLATLAQLGPFSGLLRADDTPSAGPNDLDVEWRSGPMNAELGELAEVKVPDGYVFLNGEDTDKVLRKMGNLAGGDEKGAVFPASDGETWFLVFQWDDTGYVKDEERDELDADALLETLRENNRQANALRRERGLTEMEMTGWEAPPRYDPTTSNLEWGIRLRSDGQDVLNYEIRYLGRRGVMSATLVSDPADLQRVLPTAKGLLRDYSFKSGHRYSEFSQGDKIAEYGLKGLVLGGAAAAAVKFGLFQKFWKVIVLAIAGAAAGLKRFISRWFGRSRPGVNPTSIHPT